MVQCTYETFYVSEYCTVHSIPVGLLNCYTHTYSFIICLVCGLKFNTFYVVIFTNVLKSSINFKSLISKNFYF